MFKVFEIHETKEFGLTLRVSDTEIADKFDDYLTEVCHVSYATKFKPSYVEFYFGQVIDSRKLNTIIGSFCNMGEMGE